MAASTLIERLENGTVVRWLLDHPAMGRVTIVAFDDDTAVLIAPNLGKDRRARQPRLSRVTMQLPRSARFHGL